VSTEQPTTFTTAKVEKEPPTTPMKTTSARLQNRTEKKEQKEKKEKSAEILAHERMIDEKLAVYIKALETNDAATAREEFNNYLKLNLFVPPIYLGKGIQMFVKNEAWSEGATFLQGGNAHSNDNQRPYFKSLWVRAHSQLGTEAVFLVMLGTSSFPAGTRYMEHQLKSSFLAGNELVLA
jgi:hypothetical protein